MMLGDTAVSNVYRVLQQTVASDQLRVFKYEKESGYTGSYIVINHLPFVRRDVVEEGTVNINIHVPKLKDNRPNTAALALLVPGIASIFPEDTFIDGAYYEYYCDSRPTPDNDGTYYVNLQLRVIFSNLNE